MLFYLKYINHDVEKLQELFVYFFDKVETIKPTTFDRNTLLPNWYSTSPKKMRNLERDLESFIALPFEIKQKIIDAFKNANKIEEFFSNKTLLIPTALDFDEKYRPLLDSLFTNLYKTQLSKRLIDSSVFPKIINNDLSNHFKRIKDESYGDFTVCPFCGIEEYTLIESEERPSYDHLLPKGNKLFVFSSINMKNLFPMGTICNKLKETSNLLYIDNQRTTRTIAFYPYDNIPHPFELIEFELECKDRPNFNSKGVWDVNIRPKKINDLTSKEKIATWTRVFNINNRYIEYIQTKNKSWTKQLLQTYDTVEEALNKLDEKVNKELPLNFLSLAIISGCIPLRIFYLWILANPDYLESLMNANKVGTTIITNNTNEDLV